ncbi:hypothetical protein SARC_13309, partial [Sphaeroforma arctica JP610]
MLIPYREVMTVDDQMSEANEGTYTNSNHVRLVIKDLRSRNTSRSLLFSECDVACAMPPPIDSVVDNLLSNSIE